jgi:hypothetical protein
MLLMFTQAHGRHSPRRGPITWLVLHTTESDIGPAGAGDQGAERTAAWMAGATADTSSHYVVDDDSTIQCVALTDEAWTQAPWNPFSVSIEQEGRAAFTRDDWLGPHSGMLDQTAKILADCYTQLGIPLRYLASTDLVAGLKAGVWPKGVTSHVELNTAARTLGLDWCKANTLGSLGGGYTQAQFFALTSHTDPGTNYPIDEVLARARRILDPTPTPIPDQEDDMTPFSMRPAGYANQFVVCSAGVLVASTELLAKLGLDPNGATVYVHRQTLLSQMRAAGLTAADMVRAGEALPAEHQL